MGYTVITEGIDFIVPGRNVEAALVALKGAAALGEDADPAAALIKTIEEDYLFDAFDTTDGGVGLSGYCNRSAKQDELILALTPFADEGSYIEWRGEQDERWRDLVHNGRLYTQHPTVTWGPDPTDPGLAAADPTPMRTVIPTLYRDGTNCKIAGQIRLTGLITRTQVQALRAALDEGLYYTPADLGYPHLGQQACPADFPVDGVDHCWHEMDLDNIDIVAAADLDDDSGEHIDHGGTPTEFVAAVSEAAAAGWPASTGIKGQ